MVGGVSENASPDAIEIALRDLRYDRSWLTRGLLSPENLLRQHQDFCAKVPWSTDLEHFHINAFHAWRIMRYQFTDAEIEDAIAVLMTDTDLFSTSSLLLSLLQEALTDQQFDRILEAACSKGLGSKTAAFERFLRTWSKGTPNDEYLRASVDSGIAAIHLFLVKKCDVPWVLEALKTVGTSKEVRHVATQRLLQLQSRQRHDP